MQSKSRLQDRGGGLQNSVSSRNFALVQVACAYDIPMDVGGSTLVYFANIIRLHSPEPLGRPRKNAEGNSLAEECWFIDSTNDHYQNQMQLLHVRVPRAFLESRPSLPDILFSRVCSSRRRELTEIVYVSRLKLNNVNKLTKNSLSMTIKCRN